MKLGDHMDEMRGRRPYLPRPMSKGGTTRSCHWTRQRYPERLGLRGLGGSKEREDCGKVQIYCCAALLDNWTAARAHVGPEIADAGDWELETEEKEHAVGCKVHKGESWKAENRTGCGSGEGKICGVNNEYLSLRLRRSKCHALSAADIQGRYRRRWYLIGPRSTQTHRDSKGGTRAEVEKCRKKKEENPREREKKKKKSKEQTSFESSE